MKTKIALALVLVLAGAAPTAVASHDREMVADDAAAEFGDTVTLTATLFEEDGSDCPCPEGDKQVDFYVDGEYVGTDLTDEAGNADLLVDLPRDWHPGNYTILAEWDGDDDHRVPVNDTATLTITREATELRAHHGYLEAQLTDDEDASLAGQPVTFTTTVAGQTVEICTAYTDGSGLATCTPLTGIGVQNAVVNYTATFAGDEDFVSASDEAHWI